MTGPAGIALHGSQVSQTLMTGGKGMSEDWQRC